VRNTSDIVQAYEIEVLGVPAGFATVEPPTLNLYPGTAGTATVSLLAPRSSEVRAGDYPMGVKVTPTESPGDAVVPETTIQVLPFLETTAELIPRTSKGRRGASHDLAVDNRGNVPIRCFIAAGDDNQALLFEEEPSSLDVGPGEARFATIKVKPEQRKWRGTPRTHPFQVTVTPHDGAPVLLDGTHLQEPIIPRWFWKALLALLALLLLLLALWFWLLRPAIESVAQDAAIDEVAPLVDAAQDAADSSEQSADQAGSSAAQADESTRGAEASEERVREILEDEGIIPPPPAPVADSRRLSVTTSSSASDTFALGQGETLAMTDVVFENPQGDIGTVELQVEAATVLRLALENFRAIDFHFVTPLVVEGDETVTLLVTCRTPGTPPDLDPPPDTCSVSSLVTGELRRPRP
jgi:hypothetical protein